MENIPKYKANMEKADKETAKYGNFKYDKFRALMQPNKSRRITLKKERNYLTSDDIPGAIAKSPPRHIGRDYIGVSDIAGTRPTKIVPVNNIYIYLHSITER